MFSAGKTLAVQLYAAYNNYTQHYALHQHQAAWAWRGFFYAFVFLFIMFYASGGNPHSDAMPLSISSSNTGVVWIDSADSTEPAEPTE